MLHRHEAHYFLPAPFALALCGLLFCIWNLLGGSSVPCPGNGCAVFSDFTIAGVSLWWLGGAGFALLGLCALAGRLFLGKLLAACGLWCDVALLGLMLVTTPCPPCLLVAVLLALTYLCFVHAAAARKHGSAKAGFPILILVWGLLFVANLGVLGHSLSAPWAMAKAEQESIRAYVSPSCPACRQLIRETPAARMAGISWFPVAEGEQDIRVIGAMILALRQGKSLPDAFATALEQPLAGPWVLLRPKMLLLRLRLWRNQAHVLENGGVLPALEFSGLPAFMLEQQKQAGSHARSQAPTAQSTGPAPHSSSPSSSQPNSQDASMPSELSIIGRCTETDDTSQVPCQ